MPQTHTGLGSPLSPQEISAYLTFKGWNEVRKDDVKSIWRNTNPDSANIRLLLPLQQGLDDYSLCVRLLLESLANVEGRQLTSVFRDIAFVSYDMLSFILGIDHEQRVLPLEIKANLLDCLTRILTYAASSVLANIRDPKSIEKLPEPVVRYLNELKIDISAESDKRVHFYFGPFGSLEKGRKVQMSLERSVFARVADILHKISQPLEAFPQSRVAHVNGIVNAGFTEGFGKIFAELLEIAGDQNTLTVAFRSSAFSPIANTRNLYFPIASSCKEILSAAMDTAEDEAFFFEVINMKKG